MVRGADPAQPRSAGGELALLDSFGFVVGSFDVEVWEVFVEPGGHPPHGFSAEVHDGGEEEEADDEGVDEDGGGEADAHHGECAFVADGEGAEDGDHDDGGGG